MTDEHLATQALFTNHIRVDTRPGGWFDRARSQEFPIASLKEKILCREHNGELGRTADRAAIRLLRFLRASHQPMSLRGSALARTPVDRRLSGVDFARWLCKTHCNFMTVKGIIPDPLFVRYAFVRPLSQPLYFYFPGDVGEVLRFANSNLPWIRWRDLVWVDARGSTFEIALAGFKTVVSTVPITDADRPFVDRLRELHIPTPLGAFKIIFDWAGEPAVEATNEHGA